MGTAYVWGGATSGDWATNTNWAPNGIPGADVTDDVTINASGNSPVLDSAREIRNFVQAAGTLDLGGFQLKATGAVAASGGAINNGTFKQDAGTSTAGNYTGTTFGAAVDATAGALVFNNGTFNSTLTAKMTGGASSSCTGGNTFNGVSIFEISGSTGPVWYFASSTLDTHNGVTTYRVSAGNGKILASHGANSAYNENIVVENYTGFGTADYTGVWFGVSGGVPVLANGKTISVGGGGFSGIGSLVLQRFTQTGATAQSVTLTGVSKLVFGASGTGPTFNAACTFSSPTILFSGGTFNGATDFIKTGSVADTCYGGTVFNAATLFKNTGSAAWTLANTAVNTYTGNVTFWNAGSGSADILAATVGNAAFAGNIVVESTFASGNVGVSIGVGSTSVTLATGKTITVGANGFVGKLTLTKFTQTGSTAQTLALSSGGVVILGPTNVWNGNLAVTATSLQFLNSTYNGTLDVTKIGNSLLSVAGGGNTFNGAVSIAENGSSWGLTIGSTAADTFNSTLLLNGSSGTVNLAAGAAGTQFNDNITFSCTGAATTFGASGGTSTLADTKTISCSSHTGNIYLKNFTQTGTTAQSISSTHTGSRIFFQTGTVFNGNLTVSFGNPHFDGATFNGTVHSTKVGVNAANGTGGCTFNAAATFVDNSLAFSFQMGTIAGDIFNSDVTYTSNVAYNSMYLACAGTTVYKGNVVVNGTAGVATFNHLGGVCDFQKATGTQTLAAGTSTIPNLTHSGAGTLQFVTNNVIVSTALDNSAGTMDLNGKNLTATGATFSNAGTIKLNGTETVTGLTQDIAKGTWDYTGAAGSYTVKEFGATDYFNLRCDLDPTLNSSIKTAGKFTLLPGATPDFKAGETFDFASIDWTGTSGSNITLRSTTPGSKWNLKVGTVVGLAYVDVADSDASSGVSLYPATSTDNNGNTNWKFYTLTITNGTGDGVYENTEVVSISADAPAPGYMFDKWTGDIGGVANINAATTTNTMSPANATIVATYAVTPPVANFSGAPTTGNEPLMVAFTDSSTNTPTSWLWDFGDLGSSILQNPTHIYAANGVYTVKLTATNAGGSDDETKVGYISVSNVAINDVDDTSADSDEAILFLGAGLL